MSTIEVQNLNELNRQRNQNGFHRENEPYMEISEHPQSRGFRFRYQCEGTSHGGLQGESSRRDRKSYPGVKIVGYKGPARITVSLVTDDSVPRPHAHELIGKNCKNGLCEVDLKGDHMTATFPNLGVRHVTKKKVMDVLTERIIHSMKVDKMMAGGVGFDAEKVYISEEDRERARIQAEEQARTMSLNTVRLCFQATLQDGNGSYNRMLPSVISKPIFDSKSPGAAALKICRMDKHAGCCTGNDEVFLLCDKVQKDDIAVRFFETDEEGNVKWQGYGTFGPADVHRQYAVVFKTPPYWNTNIERPVQVHVQLVRISDQEASDAKPFTYYPQQHDQEEIGKKRKKPIPHFGCGSAGGGFQQANNTAGGFGGSGGSDQYTSSRGGQGSTLPFSALNTVSHTSPVPSPATDENSRDSATSASSMSVGSSDLQIDIETDGGIESMDIGEMHPTVAATADGPSASALAIITSPSVIGRSEKSKATVEHSAIPKEKESKKSSVATNTLQAAQFALSIAERTTTALQNYARTGDISCLLLVQRQLVAIQDECGDNVLHLAVMHCQTEAVSHLLEVVCTIPNNMVVNQFNSLRQTPLHLATVTNQPEIVELLLRHGAALYVQDYQGNTPLHLAAKHGSEKCLKKMMKFGRNEYSTDKHPFPQIDLLNYDGFSVLHLAVERGLLNPVKMLTLDGRADVDSPDGRSGRRALHHAVSSENLAITGFLVLEAMADVNAPDYDENTPLHLAATADMLGIAAVLVAAGADPDLQNSWILEEGSDTEETEEGETTASPAGAAFSSVQGKRKASEELHELVGCTPRDLVIDNDRMLRILAGEPYAKISMVSTAPLTSTASSGISSGYHSCGASVGDLDKLDAMVQGRMARLLDPPAQEGRKNWQDLANTLGLEPLTDALSLQDSPTKAVLANYEGLDGTISEMRTALTKIGRTDVVSVLDELLLNTGIKPAIIKPITSDEMDSTYGSSDKLRSDQPSDSGFGSVKGVAPHHFDQS